MKHFGAAQQDINGGLLDDCAVSDYLLKNPDFFIRNACQVEQMLVPHQVHGTISLVEWQLACQRHHIQQLEENIIQLMDQASTNEQLFDRLLTLQAQLASSHSLHEMINHLHLWALEFGLAGVSIRLFSDKWNLISAPSDFMQLSLSRRAFESIHIQRLGKQNHYLGCLSGREYLLLLPQAKAKAIGSIAMSLLGKEGDLGVLIFSSRDRQHYQAGMGTMLLQYLSMILPELLSRWIEYV